MEVPVVVALNMADIADSKHIHINRTTLNQALNAPVVRTIARKEEGTRELLDAIIDVAH